MHPPLYLRRCSSPLTAPSSSLSLPLRHRSIFLPHPEHNRPLLSSPEGPHGSHGNASDAHGGTMMQAAGRVCAGHRHVDSCSSSSCSFPSLRIRWGGGLRWWIRPSLGLIPSLSPPLSPWLHHNTDLAGRPLVADPVGWSPPVVDRARAPVSSPPSMTPPRHGSAREEASDGRSMDLARPSDGGLHDEKRRCWLLPVVLARGLGTGSSVGSGMGSPAGSWIFFYFLFFSID